MAFRRGIAKSRQSGPRSAEAALPRTIPKWPAGVTDRPFHVKRCVPASLLPTPRSCSASSGRACLAGHTPARARTRARRAVPARPDRPTTCPAMRRTDENKQLQDAQATKDRAGFRPVLQVSPSPPGRTSDSRIHSTSVILGHSDERPPRSGRVSRETPNRSRRVPTLNLEPPTDLREPTPPTRPTRGNRWRRAPSAWSHRPRSDVSRETPITRAVRDLHFGWYAPRAGVRAWPAIITSESVPTGSSGRARPAFRTRPIK